MNRKFIFSILILFFIFLGVSVYDTQAVTLDANNPIAAFSVEIRFFEPVVATTTISVLHTPIERVSVNMRTLVATGTVVLENSDLGNLFVRYYTDNDPTLKTSSVTYQKTGSDMYSFVTNPVIVDTGAEYIYYKIIASAQDGTEGEFPEGISYVEANLKQMKSQLIGQNGGVLTLQSGDQTRGNTVEGFAAGALLSASNFRIKELYTNETLPYLGNLRPIIVYEFTPADIIVNSQALMPSITLYYGDLPPNMNNIEVRWLSGTKWDIVNFTNNTDMRTVTINLALTNTKLGYYGIFEKTPLTDNDYRPEFRVFKLGEKLVFRNLQAGDSVTIFDINGRQVKKLTSPPFEWDGTKDTGGYAESGSYIYQIKVNGKTISGSVAFVK